MAYSLDLRKKVIETCLENKSSLREIADRFKVSVSFVCQLSKRYKQTGDVKALPKGKKRKLSVEQQKEILEVADDNKLTQKELVDWCKTNKGLLVSQATISRVLKNKVDIKLRSSKQNHKKILRKKTDA